MSLIATAARAPYALRPVAFPLPSLAAMAARAPLGGPREIALACLLAGRLVIDARDPGAPLTTDQRRARAQSAKHWLASATLPAPVRVALGRLAESTGMDQAGPMRAALDAVMTVTANQLDAAARLELGRLAQTLAE